MKKKLLISGGILVLILVGLFIIGINNPPQKDVLSTEAELDATANPLAEVSASSTQLVGQYYKVNRVVDGDTLKVQIGANEETVRLIGINTPETVDPRKPVECFGVEASNRAKELLTNKNVRLEADTTQDDRDKYGRLLRYVYLEDGSSFNLMMIRDGFAYEYTYVVPYKFQLGFKASQRSAEDNHRGLWAAGACAKSGATPVTPSPAPTPITPPSSSTTPPPPSPSPSTSCTIKGNISSIGEKIYHLPGCASYNITKIDEAHGEHWFCSESEALNVGWRKAKNC